MHLDGGAWVESAVFFAGNVVHAIFSQFHASKLSLSANLQGPRGIRLHGKRYNQRDVTLTFGCNENACLSI